MKEGEVDQHAKSVARVSTEGMLQRKENYATLQRPGSPGHHSNPVILQLMNLGQDATR
jgi:hypothetical protein